MGNGEILGENETTRLNPDTRRASTGTDRGPQGRDSQKHRPRAASQSPGR